MSKLSFRARALDATRPMQVFRGDEVPDMSECTAINRSVPQMPTGMEKEEESEHHLQVAITAQLQYGATETTVIPTPEVFDCLNMEYDKLYPTCSKMPRPYIHVHLLSIEHDYPDYDADEEDCDWINEQSKHLPELTTPIFEQMMDTLEKASTTHAVSEKDAKSILRADTPDLIQVVYDYWLNKRLKYEHALTPVVRTEKREGAVCSNNPYVAFRRRTEKMQTRKNRKNDEVSYEKMLKLKRDFIRSLDILDAVKRREANKRELLRLDVEIFDKRFRLQDFNGQIYHEVSAIRPVRPPSYYNNVPLRGDGKGGRGKNEENVAPGRKRRERKKAREGGRLRPDGQPEGMVSSDEEQASAALEEEEDPDGIYAFKRKKGCQYLEPLDSPDSSLFDDFDWSGAQASTSRQRAFYPVSISRPRSRAIGLARRRVGRGGRIVLDRLPTAHDDDLWSRLNGTDSTNPIEEHSYSLDPDTLQQLREWPHYRPSATTCSADDNLPYESEDEDWMDPISGALVPKVPISLSADMDIDPLVDEGFYSSYSTDLNPYGMSESYLIGPHHHRYTLPTATFVPNSTSSDTSSSICDLASFRRHEEELALMQNKQAEGLLSRPMTSSRFLSETSSAGSCSTSTLPASFTATSSNVTVESVSQTDPSARQSEKSTSTSTATAESDSRLRKVSSSLSGSNNQTSRPLTLDQDAVNFAMSALKSSTTPTAPSLASQPPAASTTTTTTTTTNIPSPPTPTRSHTVTTASSMITTTKSDDLHITPSTQSSIDVIDAKPLIYQNGRLSSCDTVTAIGGNGDPENSDSTGAVISSLAPSTDSTSYLSKAVATLKVEATAFPVSTASGPLHNNGSLSSTTTTTGPDGPA